MTGPIILCATLVVIAGAHVYWAFGGRWPGEDDASLIAFVIGDPRLKEMPSRALTLAVVAALLAAAVTALLLGFQVDPVFDKFVGYAAAGFCAVFGTRGVMGFTKSWRAKRPLEPFATLNKLVYSPACVLIAEAFFTLLSPRF